MIACTSNEIYYFRDYDLLKIVTNPFTNSIKYVYKIGRYFGICTEKDVGIFSRNDDDIQLHESSKIQGNI